jgi:membrane protease YdiL (CAAX protease family)
MFATPTRQKALLPLVLLVGAASLGTTMALHLAPGLVGQTVFLLCKIWMLGLPLVWYVWIDRGKICLSLPKRGELFAGTVLGLLMLGMILGAYWLFGQQWIDPISVRTRAQQVGISSSTIYLMGAAYFTLINSLIEEYVWRWFVSSKCEILVTGIGAILLAALLFTLHHIIGLAAYTGWRMVLLGSFGVFVGGAIWSWCYLTYRSIWSSWISHLLADLAIAIVGWQLLFG